MRSYVFAFTVALVAAAVLTPYDDLPLREMLLDLRDTYGGR